MNPRRIVVMALFGTLAVNVARNLQQGHVPQADIGVGAALSGTLLLGVAEFAPQVATGLAILMLMTALLDPTGKGGQIALLHAVGSLTGQRQPPAGAGVVKGVQTQLGPVQHGS